MVWEITQIDVLKPIRFFSVRRNEVQDKISAQNVHAAMSGRLANLELGIEARRVQRAAMVGSDKELEKYREMFCRRARKGQCFHRPYLGCREFPAEFAFIENGESLPEAIPETRDLGWMLHDIDYGRNPQPRFFRAELRKGCMAVPPWDVRTLQA